jgi:hypothetical protein
VVKLEAVVLQERAEELVWRHAKPSLIESCKRHRVPFYRCGERGVQSCSTMAQEEGKGSAFRTLVFLPISLFFFRYLPFFAPSFLFCPGTGKEERRE